MRFTFPTVLVTLTLALAAAGLQAQKAAPMPAAPPKATPSVSATPMAHTRHEGIAGPRDQAHGFAHISRPSTVPRPTSGSVLTLGAQPRATAMPTAEYWGSRDLLGEIGRMARHGYIPTTAGRDLRFINSWCYFPAGWWSYAFVVPPKESIHIRLHHPSEGWFRLHLVDRWGFSRKEGMLQNLHYLGNPEVSYISPLTKPTTVYVIVDDPGWKSSEKNPYTLVVERSWDTEKYPTPDLPPALGIWYHAKTPGTPMPPAEQTPKAEAPAA